MADIEKTFIEKFGAILIAVIALIQPWIIFLWKKYFKPGTIDFFETGNIEIGFSNFASTIGINGTLRCRNKDLYISQIKLHLLKSKNSSRYTFDWAVLRDTKLNLTGNKDMEFELPYGFLLSTQSPKRINIQFHDRKQQEELRPIYDLLVSKWQEFLNHNYPYENRRNDSDNQVKANQFFNEFRKTPDQTNAYSKFNQEFYWEQSEYTLSIEVITSKPDKRFTKSFKFMLTEEECQRLRYNVLTIIDTSCGQPWFDWNFVYSNYE